MMLRNSKVPEKDSVAPRVRTSVTTRANTFIIDSSTVREARPTNVRNALTTSAGGTC